MSSQTKAEQRVRVNDNMSTAAAAAELNARSRAFSNTVAKVNLAKASASLNHAKQLISNSLQTAKIEFSSK